MLLIGRKDNTILESGPPNKKKIFNFIVPIAADLIELMQNHATNAMGGGGRLVLSDLCLANCLQCSSQLKGNFSDNSFRNSKKFRVSH